MSLTDCAQDGRTNPAEFHLSHYCVVLSSKYHECIVCSEDSLCNFDQIYSINKCLDGGFVVRETQIIIIYVRLIKC